MARYCYKERQLELFTEVFARAILAASRDFPHWKSRKACVLQAIHITHVLEPEVCCIPADVTLYQTLVGSGFASIYESLQQLSEREAVVRLVYLRAMDDDEALRCIRSNLAGAPEVVEKAYVMLLEDLEVIRVVDA